MGFKLLTVPAGAGLQWVLAGLQEMRRHPLAYGGIMAVAFALLMVLGSLPVIGPPMMLASVPLLNLAFMMAVHASRQGHKPGAGVFLAPWVAPGTERRQRLLALCGAYMAASMVAVLLGSWVDGGAMARLMDAMASDDASPETVDSLMQAPGLLAGLLVRLGLTVLVSVPFWHAPALIVWADQGVAQSLFSSTLAMARAWPAFTLYGLGWVVVLGVAGSLISALTGLLQLGSLGVLVLLPLMTLMVSAYYVSQYHTFVGCFVVREQE
ncbi:BPSS1780 family membrane protein [Ideonella livida]|uniref:Transmembrane protein n=1 Tax=Ideonella livida TaxID=2707176 RepID=A0A7C9PGY7_9BURK|nr:BPSS1780 family membrane protein [Ideonella livida]NDY91653.1 hypothetical protein [Ideonella livida]